MLPRAVGGASGVRRASKIAPSLEPVLPLNFKTKGHSQVSKSRHNTKSRAQRRNWSNEYRNDEENKFQHTPQSEDHRRHDQEHPYGHQDQHQYQPQLAPVNLDLEHPDYFNYNPSNGLHTPLQIYPGAYQFAPQSFGYFPTLPPSHPILMPIPPSPPCIGQFDLGLIPLEALAAEFHEHRVWDELEEVYPMWPSPHPPVGTIVDPFVDPLNAWAWMHSSQAGFYPYQRSMLRPWANDFVPGRLFHPISGW